MFVSTPKRGENKRRGVITMSIQSLHNVTAEKWALQNAGSTYPDLSDKERKTISEAVAKFVRQSRFTLGDVVKILREEFSEEQAQSIATTEITRAYAHAAQIEGEEMKREHRDVKVIKTWFTNRDGNVCNTCSMLEGKLVEITEEFTEGVFLPPAHEGCRCWISSRTSILDS